MEKNNKTKPENLLTKKLFDKMNIRRKTTLVIMLVTLFAILLTGLSFNIYEWITLRQRIINDISMHANMLAYNSMGALSFDDPDDATDVLKSLQAKTSIEYACIYRNDGSIFAIYERDKSSKKILLEGQHKDGHKFEKDRLIVFKSIIMNNQSIGTVYLQSDLDELNSFIKQSFFVLTVIIAISFLAAFLLSAKLQGVISGPIMLLAETAGDIARKKDYSVRAVKHSEDEVGFLIDSFNEMLDQIQRSNNELSQSEIRFRTVVEQAADALFLFNSNGKIFDINQRSCQSLGYTREQLLSMNMTDIDIEIENHKHKELFWDKLTPGSFITLQGVHLRKDRTTFPVEIRLGLLELSGKKYMLGLARDISERKEAEEQLKASLKEKEILLAEIHHRVKNNMAIISSFLQLQTMMLTDEKIIHLLKESQQRIKAMALVHERLYKSENFKDISVKDYITELVNDILQTYDTIHGEIKILIDVNNCYMTLDTLIPFGLIINEIITNSIKHAFTKTNSPEIQIRLSIDKHEQVNFIIGDNGIGLPESAETEQKTTLGLIIIDTLVKQLDGEKEISRIDGTTFKINFSLRGTNNED